MLPSALKPEDLSHPQLLLRHNDLSAQYAVLRQAYRSLLSQHQADLAKWKAFKVSQDKITERTRASLRAIKDKKRRRREEALAVSAVKAESKGAEGAADVSGGDADGKALETRKQEQDKLVSRTCTTSDPALHSSLPRHDPKPAEPIVIQFSALPQLRPRSPDRAPAASRLLTGPASALAREDRISTPSRKAFAASTPNGSKSVVAGRVSPWLGGVGIASRPKHKASRCADSFEEENHGPVKRSVHPPQPNSLPAHSSLTSSTRQPPLSPSRRQPLRTLISSRPLLSPPSVPSTSITKRKAVSPPANAPNSKRAIQVDRGMLDVRAKAPYDSKAEADSMKVGKEVYKGYKGRDRAELKDSDQHAPIEQFEINPNANGGLNYAYNQTVRKKDERKKMHATDCECCSDYWKRRGHFPAPQGPIWKDPPKQSIEESAEPDEPHRDTSRHREQWARNSTPPGYWEIGFPNTPAVENLNRRADEIQAAKENKIRREAKRNNGQWRKKT